MIILHFHLQPQFKYELFHILHITQKNYKTGRLSFIISGREDSSGVTLYYADELREYDSGIVSVGRKVDEWFIIPPKRKNWMTIGYCTHECSEVN